MDIRIVPRSYVPIQKRDKSGKFSGSTSYGLAIERSTSPSAVNRLIDEYESLTGTRYSESFESLDYDSPAPQIIDPELILPHFVDLKDVIKSVVNDLNNSPIPRNLMEEIAKIIKGKVLSDAANSITPDGNIKRRLQDRYRSSKRFAGYSTNPDLYREYRENKGAALDNFIVEPVSGRNSIIAYFPDEQQETYMAVHQSDQERYFAPEPGDWQSANYSRASDRINNLVQEFLDDEMEGILG